jgi:hypothetical protein
LRAAADWATFGAPMLGLAAATWLASIVAGEPSVLELEWTAPSECPDADDVRARLEVYLGDDAVPSSHRAVGVVEADADGWRLQLEIDGQLRELRSRHCEALADAAAVVLSLAMDPERARDEPAPAREPEPAAVAPDPATAAIEPPPRTRRMLRAAVRADTGISYGIAPASNDVQLTVALLWPNARLELSGWLIPPGRNQAFGGERLRIFYGSAGPRGCYIARIWRFEVPLCGGLEVGALRVEARPAAPAPARHAVFAGLTAGAALVWPFHRVAALWLGGQAIAALGRPRVTLPSGAVYRGGSATVRASLGIELRFP